jgi:signal transduction histidine kinase
VISLTPEFLARQQAIGHHLAVATDKDGVMEPASILAGQHDKAFVDTGDRNSFSFGANRNWPHWAIFAVDVPGDRPQRVLLESAYVAIDKLTVYHLNAKGEKLSQEALGDKVAFAKRAIPYRYPVFILDLVPGLNYVMIKVETGSLVVFDFTLYTETAFHGIKTRELIAVGLMLGGIFTILVYNLFLFLSTKDGNYGLYVIYVCSYFIFAMSYYGVAPYFVFTHTDDAPLTGWGLYVVIDFITIGSCLFATRFLNLKAQSPWFHRALILVTLAAGLNSLIAMGLQGRIGGNKEITLLLSMIMGPLLLSAGFVQTLRGYGPAVHFCVAWAFVIVGNTMVLLAGAGLIEKNFATSWSQLFGANMEMLFLSFALGARINLIKAEKLRAERLAGEASAKALNEERRLNEQRDQLVANTSHELRTPLNGMMGLIQAIIKREGDRLSPETQRSLNGVVVSAKRLASLIGDLLDFSRGQRSQIPLYRGRLNVQENAQQVLDLLQQTLDNRDVKLQLFMPEDLPAVHADPDRLQQILFNLVGNACKFTEQGHIEISAKADGDRVLISVEDTGPGIAPEAQAYIFEAFAQADGGAARRYGGTGLGLAIVKQLVEAHGGEIGVQSTPGFGSTFWFSLPVSRGDEEIMPTQISPLLENKVVSLQTQIEAGRGHGTDALPALTPVTRQDLGVRLNILVVDDEPMNRQVLQEILSLNGHQVTVAHDGPEALKVVQQDKIPDLILLDVMMPGMSGLQVLGTLRQKFNEAELPIILLTAKAMAKDVVEGFSQGASDYILKPFVAEEVEARIMHQARLKQAIWDSESAREESAHVRQQLSQTEDQLLHAERLASIGAATAGIAHDLGNPLHHISTTLGWIRNRVETIEKMESLPAPAVPELQSIHETIDLADKAASTAVDLTQAIRVAVRTDDGAIGLLSVKSVVDDALTILHHKMKQLELSCECDPELAIRGKRSELIQLIMNLASNAADAIAESSPKKLSIRVEKQNDQICLTVEDSGPGIPEKLRAVIFDPFYTTKPSGKGTGLGLAVVRTVTKHHGGSLSVDVSPSLGGARFKVLMPAA